VARIPEAVAAVRQGFGKVTQRRVAEFLGCNPITFNQTLNLHPGV
jgi:hypothetical protein